jgi:hypothetical protein
MYSPILFWVISQLLLPEEVVERIALSFVKIIDYISIVHLDGDEGHDDLSDDRRDLSSDNSGEIFKLVDNDIEVSFDSFTCDAVLFNGILSVESPDDLGSNSDHLTGLGHDPICLLFVLAVHPLIETHTDDSSH